MRCALPIFRPPAAIRFPDLVLFIGAPFLAVFVEAYLDFPEKTALIILSLAFIASVVDGSAAKGLIAASLGMLFAYVGTGEDFYPRLTFGLPQLASGFPVVTAILGVLILGEVFKSIEDMWCEGRAGKVGDSAITTGDNRLGWPTIRALFPYIANSAALGTMIGALPGIGSTLAATLGYASGKRLHARRGNPWSVLSAKGRRKAWRRPKLPTALSPAPILFQSCHWVFPATPQPCSWSWRRTP